MKIYITGRSEKETEKMSVSFTTFDGFDFKMTRKCAKIIDRALPYIENRNADDDISIPLPEVGSIHMKKIVEFCKHYVTDPMNEIAKPLISNDICDCCITEFYRNFIEDYDINEIALLLNSANYMSIKPLVSLCGAKIALHIYGKTPEEIMESFQKT